MNIKGKTVLVTGGSSGLGFAIAQKLLAQGAKVAICGNNKDRLEKAKAKLNSQSLMAFTCDVRNYSRIEKMVKDVGQIDILINNAGVWLPGELDDYDPQAIADTININLTGSILVTRAVLPQMRQSNSGIIFNISSTSGTRPKFEQSVYVASKFGLMGFTDSLKLDLASTNIRVIGFYPGGMKTPLFKKSGDPVDTTGFMDPSDVADVVILMLQTDKRMILDHVVLNRRS